MYTFKFPNNYFFYEKNFLKRVTAKLQIDLPCPSAGAPLASILSSLRGLLMLIRSSVRSQFEYTGNWGSTCMLPSDGKRGPSF